MVSDEVVEGVMRSALTSISKKDKISLQELRIKHKPGCIPPYVSLNKTGSVQDVIKAEREYLIEKNNNPYFTDLKYFFKAIYNILFKRKRSA